MTYELNVMEAVYHYVNAYSDVMTTHARTHTRLCLPPFNAFVALIRVLLCDFFDLC